MVTRRNLLIWVAFCSMAIGALFWWLTPSDTEPMYQGKALSEWLKIYDKRREDDLKTSGEPEIAVRAIGTNALPYLLKWVQYEPKPWKRAYLLQLRRLPDFIGESDLLCSIATSENQLTRAWLAEEGFRILGPSAASAIPEVVQIMNGTNSPDLTGRASWSLCWLGKDALPPLLNALTNSSSPASLDAAFLIGNMSYLGTNVNPAIPFLIQCSKDKNRLRSVRAIRSLCRLQAEPQVTIPAILSALADEGPFTGATYPRLDLTLAVKALSDFGTNARPFIPDLIQVTTRTNAHAAQAAEVLGNLALDPETVIPALTNCLMIQDERIQMAALHSLANFGSASRSVIPILIAFSKSKDYGVALAAVESLGQLGMESELVIPALTNWVLDLSPQVARRERDGLHHQYWFYPNVQEAAIKSIGSFGSRARSAIPVLTEALKGSRVAHTAAEKALREIQSGAQTNAPIAGGL